MLDDQARLRRKKELRKRLEPIFIASVRHVESELMANELYVDRASVVDALARKFPGDLDRRAIQEGLDLSVHGEDLELFKEIAAELARQICSSSIH